MVNEKREREGERGERVRRREKCREREEKGLDQCVNIQIYHTRKI